MRTILLQTDLVATEAVAAAEQTVDKLRVIELLIKGGWIMIPIILLGIIGIYIFIF